MLVFQTDKTDILSALPETHYAIFIRNKLRKVINVRRFDVHLRGDLNWNALLKAPLSHKITIHQIIVEVFNLFY